MLANIVFERIVPLSAKRPNKLWQPIQRGFAPSEARRSAKIKAVYRARRPVSAFAESKISRLVRIPQQDSAERAFNKRGGGEQTMPRDVAAARAATARLTDMPRSEILRRGLIRGEIPSQRGYAQ